ncbi:hypothetical protein [Methanococcoides alaskense]|uniref:Uncharacterized protein n=1 Tax=Methanococcoides alaskense TaxID=325778 RepID=A0AA90Z962_9EURY|nr:hypothetical protein [Methanococcoides alaskense]MDA0524404.1 hypothetical protein [Methanococcoides alaskense]MDR6223221.1 hypothetical protein [Methanococcoides alaskense]
MQYVSKKSKVTLMILLLLLNLVIRIPSIPHEKGWDSYFIHALANSITTFGTANWWHNWLSVFGLYPYSYASAIPFSLSGLANLTGLTSLDMEITILIFSIILGLFSIFTAYVFAGIFYNDFLFKYFMAFFFSVSQGILTFSTWEVSARGPFIIFLPLFIFILLKKMHYTRSLPLLLSIGFFLMATHHYFYFLIPLVGMFIFLKIISRFNFKWENRNYLNYIYVFGILSVFMIPFFTRSMISAGSRYDWLVYVLFISVRNIGPPLIFAFGGYLYLILKDDKTFEDRYFLGMVLIFLPFLYEQKYGIYLLILFITLAIAIALRNMVDFRIKASKFTAIFLIAILLSSVAFSTYYNHGRTERTDNYWYMEDVTYKASVWTNKYIPDGSHGIGTGGETWRLFPTSDAHPAIPTGGAVIAAYGLINISEAEVLKSSPKSSDYYFEGPYSLKAGTSVWGLTNWMLELNDIDDVRAISYINKFNMTYIIEDVRSYRIIMNSVRNKKANIFDNGRIRLWLI